MCGICRAAHGSPAGRCTISLQVNHTLGCPRLLAGCREKKKCLLSSHGLTSSGSIHPGAGQDWFLRPHDLEVLHAPSTRCHSKNMLSRWLSLNGDLIAQGLG